MKKLLGIVLAFLLGAMPAYAASVLNPVAGTQTAPVWNNIGVRAYSTINGAMVTVCVNPTTHVLESCGGGGGGGSLSATAVADCNLPVAAGVNKPMAVNLFSAMCVIITDKFGVPVDWTSPSTVQGFAGGFPINTTPYAESTNLVSGLTAAMTGTTTTAVTGVGAPGAGLHNYITSIMCGNSHATVGTFVDLQDGSGGTVFWTVPAAAIYGGAAPTLVAPLRQPTANTALYMKDQTTGANVICSIAGFKAP